MAAFRIPGPTGMDIYPYKRNFNYQCMNGVLPQPTGADNTISLRTKLRFQSATKQPAHVEWTEKHIKWLRRNVTKEMKKHQSLGRFDPLYKSVIVASGYLEADHIVPFARIINMNGFKKLARKQQLDILNFKENFLWASGTINSSRGNKSFAEWEKSGGHFLHGIPDNRELLEELKRKEIVLYNMLQSMVKDALKKRY